MGVEQHASPVVDQRALQRLQRPVMTFKNHGGRSCCVPDLFLVHSPSPLVTVRKPHGIVQCGYGVLLGRAH
jgi:hypothetical protein